MKRYKILKGIEKLRFFESANFEFFLLNFFSLSPLKSAKVSWAGRMGPNFDDYPGFQQIPCYLQNTAQIGYGT